MKSSCQEMNRPSKTWATVGRCAAASILSGKHLTRIRREHTNHYATIVPTSAKSRNQLLDARGHQWDNSTHSGSIFNLTHVLQEDVRMATATAEKKGRTLKPPKVKD